MNLRIPPCKDCEKVGCGSYHDKCEIYLEWKRQRQEVMDQDYIRRSAVDFKIRQCEATKKNKARKSRRKS